MNTVKTLEDITTMVAQELCAQLEQYKDNIPKIVKDFLEQHQETLMLSVFNIQRDSWGDYSCKGIPEALKEQIIEEAKEVLKLHEVKLSSTDMKKLTSAYQRNLAHCIDNKLYNIAQEHSEKILSNLTQRVDSQLNQINNIPEFIKTLRIIQGNT